MQIFDADATRRALGFDRLVPALRRMFVQGCSAPPRQVLEIEPGGLTSLVMPAWQAGRCYGVKTVNVAPGNAALGLPGLFASYMLFDAVTGAPLALIDGGELTARRTAAASALAASYLARADARHLLIVGAGRVGGLLAQAHRVVRDIDQVTVWSRNATHAQTLAHGLASAGLQSQATQDLAAAVRQADIVSCATLSDRPLIQGQWLRPGSHLDLIGSFTPHMREADDACLQRARIYFDTDEALAKSGDLAGPWARGVITAADLGGSLAALCRGETRGRLDAAERTVFKSVGTALEDLAAAMLVAGVSEP